MALLEADATFGPGYSERPEFSTARRENFWRFMDDPTGLASLWIPAFRAVGIGWALHRQGSRWLDTAYYREVEAPMDSCWLLDAMIGAGGRTFAIAVLSRPRGTRPFTVDDVQRLDRLRPWLVHAFRRSCSGGARQEDENSIGTVGLPALTGQLILTADARRVHQTAGLDHLLRILMREPGNYTRYVPASDALPAPVLSLLRQITGAANGSSNTPPRMRISTAYGVLTLEAKWLMPAGTLPADAARDPSSCLVAVTIELHEHAIAHAARMLRESGATPAQVKVGIQLALGKPKPAIADELGVQLSSVTDLMRRLYQTLDVHNSTELGMKIWLGKKQVAAHKNLRRAG